MSEKMNFQEFKSNLENTETTEKLTEQEKDLLESLSNKLKEGNLDNFDPKDLENFIGTLKKEKKEYEKKEQEVIGVIDKLQNKLEAISDSKEKMEKLDNFSSKAKELIDEIQQDLKIDGDDAEVIGNLKELKENCEDNSFENLSGEIENFASELIEKGGFKIGYLFEDNKDYQVFKDILEISGQEYPLPNNLEEFKKKYGLSEDDNISVKLVNGKIQVDGQSKKAVTSDNEQVIDVNATTDTVSNGTNWVNGTKSYIGSDGNSTEPENSTLTITTNSSIDEKIDIDFENAVDKDKEQLKKDFNNKMSKLVGVGGLEVTEENESQKHERLISAKPSAEEKDEKEKNLEKRKGDERIKTSRSPENRQNSKEVQEKEKYEVKKGDTLWSIAEEFLGSGYDWEKIQKANELEGTTIYPGQNLIIPKEEKEDGINDSKKEDKEGYNKSVKSKLSKEENKKTKSENNEESKDDNKEKEVNESKEKTEIDFENWVSEMENIVYEGKNENGEIKLNRQGSFLEGFKTNDLLISTENGNYSLYDEKGKFQVVDISNSEKAKSEISNLDNFMRKVEEGERKINRLEGDLKEKDQYSNKLALEKKQQIKESLENYLDSLKDGNKYDISKFDQQKMQNKMNGVDYLQEKYSSEKANETLEKAKEINKDDENFKKTIDQIGINKSEIKKVEKINIGGVLNNLPFVGNDSYLVEKSENNLGITEIKGTYYTVEASSKEDVVSKLNIIKELGEKESINNYSNSLNKIDIKQYPKSTKEE